MKQIIGYMEYDYIKIKYGMRYTMLVFIVVSGFFASKSGLGAVGYMLFGSMILASTVFGPSEQTVSFGTLVPGSTMQKVLGRHLMELIMITLSILFGVAITKGMEFAGFDNGGVDLQLVAAISGIALFLLAIQNVLLYLLVPVLGLQFANIIRMVPGYILFFFVVNEKTVDSVAGILQGVDTPGMVALGMGAVSLLLGIFLSYGIERKRQGK